MYTRSSTSSQELEEIVIPDDSPSLASALFPKSYDRLTIKIATLLESINHASTDLEVRQASYAYQMGEVLPQPQYVIISGLALSGVIGVGGSVFMSSISKGLGPLLMASLFPLATGSVVFGLSFCSKYAKITDELERMLQARENAFTAEQLRAACAEAVAAFFQAYQDFCDQPSETGLKEVVKAFDQITFTPQTYPVSLDPDQFAETDAKAVCQLFLLDDLLKKLLKATSAEEPFTSELQTYFVSIRHNSVLVEESSSEDHTFRLLWNELGMARPGEQAVAYFLANQKKFKNHKVATQIIYLQQGMLNQRYAPAQELEASLMVV